MCAFVNATVKSELSMILLQLSQSTNPTKEEGFEDMYRGDGLIMGRI